ncbi:hypothetical protein [Solimonas marina]|uniref:Uncharacterized protein n=1 Tax=Solimonas marina TaxID=2714601 RepID=A0A969WD50_9GAMM|nr:hypothetical protein [Solimonas marina]NKF23890.1 hypothetical protein [Solimonas marina]
MEPATSWHDPRLISSQTGLLSLYPGPYSANKAEGMHQPRFHNAHIDLVKTINGPSGNVAFDYAVDAEPAQYAATRTIISQLMIPWFSSLLGLPKHVIYDAVVAGLYYYPATLTAVYDQIGTGDYLGAATTIAQQFRDDLASRGPIFNILADAAANLAIVRRLMVKRMVPYLNVAIVVADVTSVVSDTSKTLDDLATIPSKMRFDVEWEMHVEDIVPDGDTDSLLWLLSGSAMRMEGSGFFPAPALEDGSTALRVHIQNSTGPEEYLTPFAVDPDGTSIKFLGSDEVIGGIGSYAPGDSMDITATRVATTEEPDPPESNAMHYVWKEVSGSCDAGSNVSSVTVVGWEYFYSSQSMEDDLADTLDGMCN